MSQKVFKVAVDLEIHAVTCPGVWLCPNGRLTLRIYILGSCTETSEKKPCFPVLYHEKFIFHRNFQCYRNLSNLHHALSQEKIYIEFIQWTSQDIGNLLATFESSLADVLYPASNFSRSVLSGVDVDLLMEPMSCFPGIIAPKIEVSTKTTIEEVVTKCKCTSCKCSTYVINPKTLSSKKSPQRSVPLHQKQVCHSLQYHRSKTNQKFESSSSTKLKSRPLVIVRHKEDEKFRNLACCCSNCKQNSQISKNHNPGSDFKQLSPINKSYQKYECSSLTQPSSNSNSYHYENFLKSKYGCDKHKIHSQHGSNNHFEKSCSICSKYEMYFSDCDFHCLDLDDFNKLNSSTTELKKNLHSNIASRSHTDMQIIEQNEKRFADLDFNKHYSYLNGQRQYSPHSHNLSKRLLSQSDEQWSNYKDNKTDRSYNDSFFKYLENFYKTLYKRAKMKALHEKAKCKC